MLEPRANVQVHYRRLNREKFPLDHTLTTAIADALNRALEDEVLLLDDVTSRCKHNGGGQSVVTVMNDVLPAEAFDGSPAVVFDLCRFIPNLAQGVIGSRDSLRRRSFPLREIAPPGDHDYLKAVGYGLAVDDHLFVVQKQGLGVPQVEEYLTWLLSKASVLGPEQAVKLQVEFRRELLEGQLDEPTGFTISGAVVDGDAEPEPEPPASPPSPEQSQLESQRVARGQAWDTNTIWTIIDVLAGAGVDLGGLKDDYHHLRAVDPNAALTVAVDFNLISRKKNDEAASAKRRLARNLKTGLSNIPHGMVRAKGKGYDQVGEDIRLSDRLVIRLQAENSPFLVLEDVKEKLLGMYRYFKESGKIPADGGDEGCL